jgi:hypothetical protein
MAQILLQSKVLAPMHSFPRDLARGEAVALDNRNPVGRNAPGRHDILGKVSDFVI